MAMKDFNRDSIQKAVDSSPRIDAIIFREDEVHPSDLEIKNPFDEEKLHVARVAMQERDRVCEAYDVPFDAEQTTILMPEKYPRANASCSPIGCGCYSVERDGDKTTWEVEYTPNHYAIFVPLYPNRTRLGEDIRRTVRHELAHCADWHETGFTTERSGTHKEWLERLDTY